MDDGGVLLGLVYDRVSAPLWGQALDPEGCLYSALP